jgi:hypothetical protein
MEHGALEHWSLGALESWSIGALEPLDGSSDHDDEFDYCKLETWEGSD